MRCTSTHRTQLQREDFISSIAKLLGFQKLLRTTSRCNRGCQHCNQSCAYMLLRIPTCRTLFRRCNSRIKRGLLRTVARRLVTFRALGRALTRLDNDHFYYVVPGAVSSSFQGGVLDLISTVRNVAGVNSCDYALCLRCTITRKSRNRSFSRIVVLLQGHLGRIGRRRCKRTVCVNSHLIFSGRGFSGLSRRMSVVTPSACRLICIGRCVRGDCNLSGACD